MEGWAFTWGEPVGRGASDTARCWAKEGTDNIDGEDWRGRHTYVCLSTTQL